jgi:integrase
MRHGFATEMLRAGYDVKTVAHAGGWKDAATVLKTYAHAIRDIRITDALTGGEMRKEKSA